MRGDKQTCASVTDQTMADDSAKLSESVTDKKRLPRMNFRPLLFSAIGLWFGIFLYARIRFGGLSASDFIFPALFIFLAIQSRRTKRLLVMALLVFGFAGVGVAGIHIYTEQFQSGAEAGTYEVVGTVESFSIGEGETSVILSDLTFNGTKQGGKMQASVTSENVRAGDRISFTATVSRNSLPVSGNSYSEYLFESGIRYTVYYVPYHKAGTGHNLLLRLNSALYDTLQDGMGGNQADVAYALLTGNSRGMDGSLKTSIREGGIAHIFAVSGLHIGILYGAVAFAFSPLLRRKSFLPALVIALCYSAFCGFTVSSVRAVIMCGVLGINRAIGCKSDFLSSVSLAATLILLFLPAQCLSSGFRLSFGACLGLALFSGTLSRAFRKLPKFLGVYLAANLSVQIFTFPILLETFGYFSVWGTLLNLVLVPIMPVLFLGLFLFSALALAIPPAAEFFLLFPKGIISPVLYVFSVADFSCVLTGFSLGGGVAVWFAGTALLTERVRMTRICRAVAAGVMCLLFVLCAVLENAVFYGCKIVVYEDRTMCAALVRTHACAVLLIDGDITLTGCRSFLRRTYGGKLDAVVVIAEDEMNGVNVGAFLPAAAVYARDEIVTGLRETDVRFAESFTVGGLYFQYAGRDKIALIAQDTVVEFDFENYNALDADLFVGKGSGGLKFFLKDGIIKTV